MWTWPKRSQHCTWVALCMEAYICPGAQNPSLYRQKEWDKDLVAIELAPYFFVWCSPAPTCMTTTLGHSQGIFQVVGTTLYILEIKSNPLGSRWTESMGLFAVKVKEKQLERLRCPGRGWLAQDTKPTPPALLFNYTNWWLFGTISQGQLMAQRLPYAGWNEGHGSVSSCSGQHSTVSIIQERNISTFWLRTSNPPVLILLPLCFFGGIFTLLDFSWDHFWCDEQQQLCNYAL